MVPTQISCFFSQRGFLWQVFSGLRSNRISIVSGCSAPLLLFFVLAFFTQAVVLGDITISILLFITSNSQSNGIIFFFKLLLTVLHSLCSPTGCLSPSL